MKIDKLKASKYLAISSIILSLFFGVGLIPAIISLIFTIQGIKKKIDGYKDNIIYIIMGFVASIIILAIMIVALAIFNS